MVLWIAEEPATAPEKPLVAEDTLQAARAAWEALEAAFDDSAVVDDSSWFAEEEKKCQN